MWAIHALIESVGGLDRLAEWVKDFRSFHEGRYIEWDEIVRIYESRA